MTDQIVQTVRVTGVSDKDTTIITLNGQSFAFSSGQFDRLLERMQERDGFLKAKRRVQEKTRLRGA